MAKGTPITYAPFGRRAIAFLIDFLLMQPYFAIGMALSKVLPPKIGKNMLYFWAGLGIWANFYNKCVLMGNTGQSWGKQAMKFALLAEEKQGPMGLTRAVIREGAHMADILTLGAGYVRPVWDSKGQTLADKLMKTVAVDLRASDGAKSSTNGAAPQAVKSDPNTVAARRG